MSHSSSCKKKCAKIKENFAYHWFEVLTIACSETLERIWFGGLVVQLPAQANSIITIKFPSSYSCILFQSFVTKGLANVEFSHTYYQWQTLCPKWVEYSFINTTFLAVKNQTNYS